MKNFEINKTEETEGNVFATMEQPEVPAKKVEPIVDYPEKVSEEPKSFLDIFKGHLKK